MPSVRVANKRGEVSRQSRPTTTVCFGTFAPIAMPSAWTMRSSRSRSATPRMSYSRKTRGFTRRVVTRSRPVRRHAPLAIHPVRVVEVAQIWPVSFVKTWHLFERVLGHIREEALLAFVDRERRPRHREQLAAVAEDPAERQHRVGDAPGDDVDHQLLDPADILAREVDHAIMS